MPGKIKDWIVYQKDDKIEAIRSEHTREQIDNIKKTGAKIISYCAFVKKNSAIDYAKYFI
jgi:hypothetical protein